ncbi:hypothetical protein BCR39DRAFT_556220 [Naematelia encephala]|uniref:holo-[acyl-carrier-protein] synthase n=1 Tax=Naematelia encephala TaxID=71784 RepID=A0A1Y2BIV4_9TREE|nr:hypothetical protein BCR39DRAFT_556220 [Naematelia encephala]
MQLFALRLPVSLPPDVYDRLSQLLSEDARARLARFRLIEDAHRSLVGRLALRWYLLRQGLIAPDKEPVFGRTGRGKPTVVWPDLDPKLAFNNSHEGKYVLLGISRGSTPETGVDVMELPSNPEDVEEGISLQLSFSERASLAIALTTNQRARRITTLWTLKEGYTKAIGQGILFGMERICVDLDDITGEPKRVKVDGKDVEEDGWSWKVGKLGVQDEEQYGWAVYWRPEDHNQDFSVEEIDWHDFVKVFDDVK